jgi:soluble lytic murein transglycosylase-like protein
MRIDFGASYKEVSRLLRASSSPAQSNGVRDFESSLQQANGKPGQIPNSTEKSASTVNRPQSEFKDPMDLRASYSFADPGMDMPKVAPQKSSLAEETAPAIEPGLQQSVKTPTVLGVRRVELAGSPTPGLNVAIDKEAIRGLLHEAGQKFGVNPSLSMAVVKAESDFNPRAVSSDGHASKGLFQLLDSTGKGLLTRGNNPNRDYQPFDPSLNVELGTSYLRYLHDIFSTSTTLPNDHTTKPAASPDSLEKLAVAAFNAGEGRVASAQRRAERAGKDPSVYEQVEAFLPKSTQVYVERVVSGKKAL